MLGDEQLHLECHLGLELRGSDRHARGRLDDRGLLGPDDAAARGPGRSQGLGPPAGRRSSGRGHPQEGQGRGATGVVVRLAQLGEADVDQPEDLLADPGLLLDEAHRKARGLAQLAALERLVGSGPIDHRQCGKCARIGGVALGPLHSPAGKILGAGRIDHRDRYGPLAQMAGQGEPVMAAGLHDHPVDRTERTKQPVQLVEPRSARADLDHASLGLDCAVATDRHRVLVRADVDTHCAHRGTSLRPRGLALLARATADARSPDTADGSRITAQRRRTRAGD
ncbi:MAG: hypothetical protein M3Z65_09895 [Chloroflexota bacterium]|nr:hypothetical protein [Chloroflexota bacterium]